MRRHRIASRAIAAVALAAVTVVAVACGSSGSNGPGQSGATSPAGGATPAEGGGAPTGSGGSSGPAGVSGPSAHVEVTGGQTVSADLPKVQCGTEVESDGSAAVTIEFERRGAPEWDFLVSVSVDDKATLAQPLQMSTDTHQVSDPYQLGASFLDANDTTGYGWAVGGMHGVLLAGSVTLKPDLSGSLDAPMRGVQASDNLADVHLTASWTCG